MKLIFIRLLERRLLEGAALVQALTGSGLADITSYAPRARVLIVPLAVSLSNNDPGVLTDPVNVRPDNLNIVFVGRMDVFQKGLDRLIEAFAEVRSTLEGCRLHLVGAESSENSGELRKLIDQTALCEGVDVILHGEISEIEKLQILRSARAYVQLSRFEGFGISVVEAAILGRPLVISNQIPLHPEVEAHRAGWVVKDAEEAAGSIRAVMSMSAKEFGMVAAGARQFADQFGATKTAPRLLAFYRQAMA